MTTPTTLAPARGLLLRSPLAGAALALALVASACSAPTGPVPITADVPEAKGWSTTTVVEGLSHPWSVAWLPDGTMLVTERAGRLRVVRDGKLVEAPVANLPEIFARGQGGLMEVSLHPNFADNRLIYLTYSTGDNRANQTAMARARLSDDATSLSDVQEIFRVSQAKPGGQHFGSRILWLPDNTMLLAIGDGGNPPVRIDGVLARTNAQVTSSNLGKVLRLTDEGKPAPGNPFESEAGQTPNIAMVYSLGHRNIQGIARDPASGRVYATEHGARGGDELNLITPGANYGWPLVTYSREYTGPRISDLTQKEGVKDPMVVWTPCIAPSGLTFVTSDRYPRWKGDLLAGGLVLQQIRRVDLDADGNVVGEEKLTIGDRVRDVRQGPDGAIYVLTDEDNGKVLKIEVE